MRSAASRVAATRGGFGLLLFDFLLLFFLTAI